MSDSRGFVALDWVRGELDSTLNQAQSALEAYESDNDPTHVRECLTRLHQVHGTLQMVELAGGARFAAELEALAQALMDGTLEDDTVAQEALMEGMLQIAAHLDRVQRGGADELGAYRSLLNRMRAARGAPPEEVSGDAAADERAINAFREADGASQVRTLRLKFQRAMLALLRRTQPPDRLWPYFDRLFTRLESITPPSHLSRLWGLAAGAMERQRAAGTVDAAPMLPILRGLDGALRRLAEDADSSLTRPPADALTRGLGALFEPPWDSDTARIIALRRQWASVNSEDDFASGADDATLATVAAALHEELAGIRDQLDLFARGSVRDSGALQELADVLQRVAGTLSVVGLDELKRRIGTQIDGIEALARGEPLSDDTVMEVASAVLEVDGRLMALAGIDSEEGEHIPGSLSDAHAAVLREVRSSLDGVKQSIVDFISSDWEHAHLSPIAGTLAAARSVLAMIPLERASDLVECCRRYLQDEILAGQRVPEWQRLDTLADAITSIDYYLERMLDDRSVPDPRLLDIAEESVHELGYPLASVMEAGAPRPSGPGDDADDGGEPPDDDGGDGGGDGGPGSGLPPAAASEGADAHGVPSASSEPDRREASSAAAGTVLAHATTDDGWTPDSLGFDMAPAAGDDAGPADTRSPWSAAVEGDLAEGERAQGEPDRSDLAPEDASPSFTFQLEDEVDKPADEMGTAAADEGPARDFDPAGAMATMPPDDDAGNIDWDAPSPLSAPAEPSFDLSAEFESTPGAGGLEAAPDQPAPYTGPGSTSASATPADDDAPMVDDDIVEVFLDEVREVLEHLDGHLPALLSDPSDRQALSEVRRAFHTLKGSGRMVGAAILGELAWSVENMLNRVIDGTILARPAVLDLLARARAAIPPLRQAFAERRQADVDVQRLMEDADILASGGSEEDLQQDGGSVEDAWDDDAPITADDDFLLDDDLDAEVAAQDAAVTSTAAPDAPNGTETLEPELIEVFDQEANEHLGTLRDYLAEGVRNGQAPPLAEGIRRALHTLKGSAAMADLGGLADLAERLEGIVRGYLEIQRSADGALLSVLERGVERIEAIREHLRQLGSEPVFADADAAFIASAEALTQELEEEHAARESRGGTLTEVFHAEGVDVVVEGGRVLDVLASGQAPADASSRLIAELTALTERADLAGQTAIARLAAAYADALRAAGTRPDGDVLARLRQAQDALMNQLDALAAGVEVIAADEVVAALAGHASPPANVAPAADAGFEGGVADADAHAGAPAPLPDGESDDLAALDLDPEMLQIFFEETDELLHDIEGCLDEWPSASARDGVMRALHTLKGGARMAGLVGLGSRVHDIETWLGRASDDDAATSGQLQHEVDDLIERVARLRRGESSDIGPVANALPDTGNPHEEAAAEVPLPTMEVDEGEDPAPFGAADVSEPMESDFDLGALEPVADVEADRDLEFSGVDETATPSGETTFAEPWQPPAQAPVAQSGSDTEPVAQAPAVTDGDPEILALFLEEALELTESLDAAVASWEREPDNEVHPEALLRDLHTLKGGARMAGLAALGDRIHDLETHLTTVRQRGHEPGLIGEVHAAIDALVAQVTALDPQHAGAPPSEPSAPEQGAPVASDGWRASEPEPVPPSAPTAVEQPATPEPAPRPPAAAPRIVPGREEAPKASPKSAAEAPLKEAPQEMIRVAAGLLDGLVSLAGESSIMRGRIQQQVVDTGQALEEMAATIERVRQQVRRVELETEAQVLFRQEQSIRYGEDDFDPLEMDRYTQLQELARTLAESASDISDLRQTLVDRARDTDTLLLQQGRIHTDLQEGLMRTRMVPFSRLLPRLQRIVRQVGRELSKAVNLEVRDAEGELDRNVLERMIPPLEHMLRNAVDHGIESADLRAQRGKPAVGTITLRLAREGGEILVEVSDDGGGVDAASVRAKAIERGLLAPDAQPSEEELLSFIMAPGFSTARAVTQISGRGVGMDVVNSEVRQMGGSIGIASVYGEGTRFTVRLPFTVSINRALMVTIGEDEYALPLNSIEGIVRVAPAELRKRYAEDDPGFDYAGRTYSLSYLGTWLGQPARVRDDVPSLPVLMIRTGEQGRAVHVDAIAGSREIVVKSLGPQFSGVQGVSGATILGDGRVVVILDLPNLMRSGADFRLEQREELRPLRREQRTKRVLVVDDSVTVRKVTTRLLERQGMEVSVAKDGVEAVSMLEEARPDVMLLDIEMPRMDGFEVARHVRSDQRMKDLPIIMITSRTGDKHRERAAALKVNSFLGKPFQEAELLDTIEALTS